MAGDDKEDDFKRVFSILHDGYGVASNRIIGTGAYEYNVSFRSALYHAVRDAGIIPGGVSKVEVIDSSLSLKEEKDFRVLGCPERSLIGVIRPEGIKISDDIDIEGKKDIIEMLGEEGKKFMQACFYKMKEEARGGEGYMYMRCELVCVDIEDILMRVIGDVKELMTARVYDPRLEKSYVTDVNIGADGISYIAGPEELKTYLTPREYEDFMSSIS